jgi:hypothetical protein
MASAEMPKIEDNSDISEFLTIQAPVTQNEVQKKIGLKK